MNATAEKSPNNCYDCEQSRITDLITEDQIDYDVCVCEHPDYPEDDSSNGRKIPEYRKLFNPFDWRISLPLLCSLRPEQDRIDVENSIKAMRQKQERRR